jgi:hypothetical protein
MLDEELREKLHPDVARKEVPQVVAQIICEFTDREPGWLWEGVGPGPSLRRCGP